MKKEALTKKHVRLGDEIYEAAKSYYEEANSHASRNFGVFTLPTGPLSYTQLVWHLKEKLGDLKGKKILDVGSGYGVLMKILEHYEADVYGAEPVKQLVKYCIEHGFNKNKVRISFAHNLSRKFKEHIGTFDAIVSARVFHPDIMSTCSNKLDELCNSFLLLRPGGYFLSLRLLSNDIFSENEYKKVGFEVLEYNLELADEIASYSSITIARKKEKKSS